MGFSIHYRSTKPIDEATADAIRETCAELIEGRTWLSCEPVGFFADPSDGHLHGSSKPNFMPHPDDIAAAEHEDLPDGTVHDVLDILSQLSRDFEVEWEVSHDESPGPVGYIRHGICDARLLEQIEPFGELADILKEIDGDLNEEDGGDEPPILPFRRPS